MTTPESFGRSLTRFLERNNRADSIIRIHMDSGLEVTGQLIGFEEGESATLKGATRTYVVRLNSVAAYSEAN